MDSRRSERVAEAIREELEEIVNYELSDPRIEGMSVTEVLLSPDARRVRIRVSFAAADDTQQVDALVALEGARHHVRRLLAERLDLYRVPALEFEPDFGADLRRKVRQVLRRIRKGRARS